MGLVSFAAGSYLAFVVASYVVVYVAERYDYAWGQAGVFNLLCVVSLAPTAMFTVMFWLHIATVQRFHRIHSCFAIGVGSTTAILTLFWVLSDRNG